VCVRAETPENSRKIIHLDTLSQMCIHTHTHNFTHNPHIFTDTHTHTRKHTHTHTHLDMVAFLLRFHSRSGRGGALASFARSWHPSSRRRWRRRWWRSSSHNRWGWGGRGWWGGRRRGCCARGRWLGGMGLRDRGGRRF